MKHQQLARQVGDSHTLSIVEKEAMAPRTVGGFTCETAHGDRIHHGNPKSIGIEGLAPTSIFSHSQVLHPGDLDPVAYEGHTLGTALSGCILEFTYIGGPV